MDARAVGQRIKAAREKKSMTQEDLAARVASNLSAAIEVLPHEEKMRVLKVVAALIGR